ncbi:MAG: hypothetical protein K2K83_01830, partial [Rikenella sp.]|nr:hypothetical protein [Rikenella sp.]
MIFSILPPLLFLSRYRLLSNPPADCNKPQLNVAWSSSCCTSFGRSHGDKTFFPADNRATGARIAATPSGGTQLLASLNCALAGGDPVPLQN